MVALQGIVLGMLAGKPEALSWDLKLDRLECEMEAARDGMQFSEIIEAAPRCTVTAP